MRINQLGDLVFFPQDLEGRPTYVEVRGFRGNPSEDPPVNAQLMLEIHDGVLQIHVWDGRSTESYNFVCEPLEKGTVTSYVPPLKKDSGA